jgi:hypothetical protein
MADQTIQVGKKIVEIPVLEKDGENWTMYREKLTEAARILKVASYLSGPRPDPFNPLHDVKIKKIIVTTVDISLFIKLIKLGTAQECFDKLKTLFDEPTATVVHDIRTSDTVRVAVHPARPRTDNVYKVSNESRRRTDLLGTTTDQERVKTTRRVGEEGRKTCGKVGEKAAAARGLGTETMDLQADSVSLATPASGPLP